MSAPTTRTDPRPTPAAPDRARLDADPAPVPLDPLDEAPTLAPAAGRPPVAAPARRRTPDRRPDQPGRRPDQPIRRPDPLGRLAAWLLAGDVLAVLLASAAAAPWTPGVAWTLGLAVPLPALAWALGGAGRRALRAGDHGRPAVVRAAVLWAIAALVVTVLVEGRPPAAVVLGALPVAVLGMLAVRWLATRAVARAARRGLLARRAVVLGADAEVAAWWEREQPRGLYDVVGRWGGDGALLPNLGDEAALGELVAALGIDVVVVVGALPQERMRRLTRVVNDTAADLLLCPGLVELRAARARVLPADGGWEVRLLVGPRRGSAAAKAALDRVLGALLLLAAAPVVAVAALAVVLTSPGGAFYGQTRVGRDGRPFRMWKLRTMVAGADRLKPGLADHNDHDGVMFKMRRDPRVTPVGAVLRRYSLDELPQLWNVVRGEMSLVGPRPPLPEETRRYVGEEPRRLAVKPGLTGLWQIGGRSDLSWADTVRLDLRYVDNWSVALDLRILLATARAVLSGRGAY